MIDVHQLRKRFGATQAVQNISFTAQNGSITGLLGANGAGKTTTLRIIAGLLRPDHGTVRIDGSGRKTLGALLDHTGLYQRLSARENLIYFGELHGLPRAQATSRADQVLTSLGLASVADRRVAGFSLGQRAKVALGRAIMHSPENLLLDEPTNGLDVPTIRALRTLLAFLMDGQVSHAANPLFSQPGLLCWMLLGLAPLALFAAALQIAVSTACRTAKEAHTYLSLLIFLPMGISMFLLFFPQQVGTWVTFPPDSRRLPSQEQTPDTGPLPNPSRSRSPPPAVLLPQ